MERFRFSNRAMTLLLVAMAAIMPAMAREEVKTMPLNIAGGANTNVAILVTDLAADTVVYAYRPDALMVPASVMKSVTTASAMMMKGKEERFTTRVMATGKIGKGGVLDGNVTVYASGDPTIESAHFSDRHGIADSIAAALRSAGIKEVKGTVSVVDDDMPDEAIPAGWLNEDVIYPYGTGHHSLNYNDNTFVLRLPGEESKPHIPDLKFNYLGGRGGVSVNRKRGSSTLDISGTTGKKGYTATISTPDPVSPFRHAVMTALKESGISVGNEPVATGVDADEKEILVWRSPRFEKILRSLMVRSDNMMAEAMLRSLAPGGYRADAIEREKSYWGDKGLDMAGIEIEDGSGLSRRDRLSARFLAELYRYMAVKSGVGADYVALFPKAGVDGTMRRFGVDTDLQGHLATKTGSMRGVQCYGGYMLDDKGTPTHAVVVMVNGFTCDRGKVKNEIQRLLLEIF